MEKLFDPSKVREGQTMFSDSPELKRIKDFIGLSPKEITFVWHYASPQSMYFAMPETEEKVRKIMAKCDMVLQGRELDMYIQCRFPEKIKKAMDRMAKMDVDARVKAREMVTSIFDNYSTYIKGFSKKEDTEAYISAVTKITRELPNLIKLKEEGFGIVEESSKSAKKGQENISQYLNSKKDI